MAHTPGFAHDIFISFSDEDNLVPAGETCWVAQFPEHLEIWLRSRGLKGLDIWWDKKWLLTKLLSGTTGVPLHDADRLTTLAARLPPKSSPRP